jgi:CheY-like chemotaxis protein
MLDRPTFDNLVHEALGHLYDFAFLERSPLTAQLGLGPHRSGGMPLHRRLLEAIDELKPPRDVAPEAIAWKIYRLLQLRFVRSLSAAAVARELGLSTRQAQRIQSIAVASLATVLLNGAEVAPGNWDVPPEAPPTDDLADPSLDDELAAVLARNPGEVEAFPSMLRSAVATVAPMFEARRVNLSVAIDPDLEQRVAPNDLVRPALVQLLLSALDQAPLFGLAVSANRTGPGVTIELRSEGALTEAGGREVSSDVERRLRVARGLLGRLGGTVDLDDAGARLKAQVPLAEAPTVLVVEDNPQVVQLFRRYVAGSPFQIVVAPDGATALDLATRLQPAAITLDLLLPQRDGWELLQALKVHPATRQIPAVVCSVLRERELAFALGAADFLAKPVSQHTFLSSLRRHAMGIPTTA